MSRIYKGIPHKLEYIVVRDDNGYVFVGENGEILIGEHWDYAKNFREGFAVVGKDKKDNQGDNSRLYRTFAKLEKINQRRNHIDIKGNLLSDVWWNDASSFSEGFAVVEKDRKFNHISSDGKLLSDTWWQRAGDFHEGFAWVVKDGKCNHIDRYGRILSKTWWDGAGNFSCGFAIVTTKRDDSNDLRYGFIDTKGKLLYGSYDGYDSIAWWNEARNFSEGFAVVKYGDSYNYIDTEGKLFHSLSHITDITDNIKQAWSFKDGLAIFQKAYGGNFYLVDSKWETKPMSPLVEPMLFIPSEGLPDSIISVKDKGWGSGYMHIDTKGEYLSDLKWDSLSDFVHGVAIVQRFGKYNFIDRKGNLLLDSKDAHETWADDAHINMNGTGGIRFLYKIGGKEFELIHIGYNGDGPKWFK